MNPGNSPRVCVYSQRGMSTHLARCGGYEFEDVITNELDPADLIAPVNGPASPLRMKVRNRLSHRTSLYRMVGSGLRAPRLVRDYDLFFCYVAFARDLLTLGALGDWRKRSARAVCWIQELWIDDIKRYGPQLEILNSFDHVICSLAGTVPALQKHLDVPVSYVPWGVDTVLFCPYPDMLERVIDFQNISRISEATHRALLEHSRATGAFYGFDSESGIRIAREPAEHRWRYADRMKRSRYLFTYKAKVQAKEERGTQEEFGMRYMEGIAGGAVLLGDRLAMPAFEEHLGWTDSVIPIPYECPQIAQIAADLDSQPERMAEARRQNVLHALRQHDYLDRWQRVLKLAGLPETAGMAVRRAKIAALVKLVEADTGGFQARGEHLREART